MFSSVRAGVSVLPEEAPAFFVHPVDIPLVRAHTLRVLLKTGGTDFPPVVYPTFDDHRGHPPLIHGDLRQAILSHDGKGGLRALLDRFGDQAMDIPVADNGVLLDMDTPDDYSLLSGRSQASAILNDEECRVLMEKVLRLPAAIIDHCRQVARVAARLAQAVNTAGADLDIPMIRSAALVHDLARLEKDHATAGARLLEQMGFSGLAQIVAVHMQIQIDEHSAIDEAQVVHLADKLVSGCDLVSVTKRFDAKLKKYGHDPTVAEKIEQRRQAALIIQAKIEGATAATLDEILS
jgi:molybdopterin-guanine dinucleotide biosynthesis protein A